MYRMKVIFYVNFKYRPSLKPIFNMELYNSLMSWENIYSPFFRIIVHSVR
jgi:hypothetical protein